MSIEQFNCAMIACPDAHRLGGMQHAICGMMCTGSPGGGYPYSGDE